MSRITRTELDDRAFMIDVILALPVGTHHINVAYGQPRLMRDGGSVDVSPRLPAGELYRWMGAYILGITAARTVKKAA